MSFCVYCGAFLQSSIYESFELQRLHVASLISSSSQQYLDRPELLHIALRQRLRCLKRSTPSNLANSTRKPYTHCKLP